ncbi:hypothetical protein SynTAK9802_00683 [Synechococcus sp. TAK9802]|nr:hypothetical protein SynTAK9802_00683 [Synechococcus sp. TAK9802]
MGLRTAVRNLLKKVFGDSVYREFRDAYRNVLYGDDKREGRVTGDLNDSKWQSVGTSTYKWVSPSKALGVAPELEEAKVAPKEPEIDVVEEEQRPLLCEKFLVKDYLLIDYVDKSGNASRRRIRVEEVYAYDDGVFVLRAWCLLRKGYRTFVSTRLKGCRDAFSKETIYDLLFRLKKRSYSDPGNVAKEILDDLTLEIVIAIYSLMNYSTGKGYEKRYVSGKKKTALVDWVLEQSMAKSLLATLDADKRSEVEDLVRESIGDKKITQSSYESCARAMKRSRYVASSYDRYEVRRQDLILFVEETLSGEGAKDTAVTRLKEDLLDPSFRIGKEIDVEKFLKEFDKVKQDSKKAERKYKSKKKEEVVSKGYRRFERGEPARLLALEVAMRHLEDCLDEERVLIGKDEFEKRIRDEVAQAFKEEELKQAGEMFRKRVGHGISTAYCAFGLRKANRSWFTDSTGKSWLDLQTRNQAD